MKKSKGQTVDLLYTKKKEVSKKARSKTKSTTKNKKTRGKKNNTNSKEIINLDNEIIIGLTPKKEESKKKKNDKRTDKKGNKKKDTSKNNLNNKKTINKGKKKKTKSIKEKRNLKFLKYIMICVLFIGALILFMMSSIFNIKQIEVINNSKINSEEIINLSKLVPGVNMFKTTNNIIRNNVKQNAYIDDVKVKRSINGTVTLDIKERIPTYMVNFSNTYVYINNQGYMLEMSEIPLEIPTITGFTTPNEDFKVGNRLNVDDLNKLDDIIKIIEASKNTSLANTITEIDIEKALNYKLTIASEAKTIQFGDLRNINIKLQMAGEIITMEKGKSGEIYFQDDAKKAVFKEEVSR